MSSLLVPLLPLDKLDNKLKIVLIGIAEFVYVMEVYSTQVDLANWYLHG